jgi:hypothetical protein
VLRPQPYSTVHTIVELPRVVEASLTLASTQMLLPHRIIRRYMPRYLITSILSFLAPASSASFAFSRGAHLGASSLKISTMGR